MAFSLDSVASQAGKIFMITGASSGIGLEAARMLASKGAHVLLACRTLSKASPLAASINAQCASDGAGGRATVVALDTTDLSTIDALPDALSALDVTALDALLLNAGIMGVAYATARTRSSEHPAVELQMATNVVGHFYTLHKLLPYLRAAKEARGSARVVSVASKGADMTSAEVGIDYEVFLNKAPEKYAAMTSYVQSKLGNLLLAHEANRRLSASASASEGGDTNTGRIRVVCAHPGYSRSQLQSNVDSFFVRLVIAATKFWSMDSAGGGLVLLSAATMPDAELNDDAYFGPQGFMALTGAPVQTAKMPAHGRDDAMALKLWETCEMLCDCKADI